MKIIHGLAPVPTEKPVCLTIGNFDGFHLGHQFVIDTLIREAKKNNALSAVITFDDHPSKVLRPQNKVLHLFTLPQKISLLDQAKVDILIILNFTQEFSQQAPEEFLDSLQNAIPFDTLVLGHDARIGKGREGNHAHIQAFAKHFNILSLEPYTLDHTIISSSLIRTLIQKGDLLQAAKFLGRPYSLQGTVIKGQGKGRIIGFPTANLAVEGLCLPPYGVYAVEVSCHGSSYKAIANLGIAPTVRQDLTPLLEIHLLGEQIDLYGKDITVRFKAFIRPEKRFASLEALKAQIHSDIQTASME